MKLDAKIQGKYLCKKMIVLFLCLLFTDQFQGLNDRIQARLEKLEKLKHQEFFW